MSDRKQNEIQKTLGRAKWLLLIGVLVILILPFVLTSPFIIERFNFSQTGQIGDTIGGITAPFLNLIGAFLVFFALQAQVKANVLIQHQIDRDIEEKESKNEEQNLNQLYFYLTENINNFHFTTLPLALLKNVENIETKKVYLGGEGIYHLFAQIRCHYHGTQEQLHGNQAVSELLSILKIMDLLIDKLENTKSVNKIILTTLVKHLFNYKITTCFRDEQDSELDLNYCSSCECNHGIPEELKLLILKIKFNLNKEINKSL